jgi:hypothetical protein
MMARPVAQYLASFEPPHVVPPVEVELPEPVEDLPLELAEEDSEALAEALRAVAFADGVASTQGAHEAALQQERLRFEAQLSDLRERWVREESARLSQEITRAVAGLADAIAASAARVLRGFIGEALRRKAIDALAEDIRQLCADPAYRMIEISGPDDLLADLRERLGDFGAGFEWKSAASIDVRVVAGPTTIETRLEAWLERLQSLPE